MTPENANTIPETPTLSPDELETEYGQDFETDVLEFPLTDEDTPTTKSETSIEEVDPSLLEKIRQRHSENTFGAFAVATTLVIGLPYAYDVEMNRLKETYSEPRIKVIVDAPKDTPDSGSNTYNINGFDTGDADEMTEDLALAFQQVSPDDMKSIDFENAELKISSLANKIIDDAERTGKEKISLVGNSTGGMIALMVAREIMQKSDLKIETIYLYETPDGFDGLKAGSKRDLAMLMDFIAPIPASEDSNYIRDILTMATEKPRYTHGNNVFEDIANLDLVDFHETFLEATEKTRNQDRPRMDTLFKQGLILANADLEAVISDIGKMKGIKYMPTVVTIMSDPQKATVVDTLQSTRNITEYLYKADINTFSIVIDSDTQRHTSYNFDTESNVEALAPRVEAIHTSHAESEVRLALINADYYQLDTVENND